MLNLIINRDYMVRNTLFDTLLADSADEMRERHKKEKKKKKGEINQERKKLDDEESRLG